MTPRDEGQCSFHSGMQKEIDNLRTTAADQHLSIGNAHQRIDGTVQARHFWTVVVLIVGLMVGSISASFAQLSSIKEDMAVVRTELKNMQAIGQVARAMDNIAEALRELKGTSR